MSRGLNWSAVNPRPKRRSGPRRASALLLFAVLVGPMLLQLTPVARAASVPVGSGTGPIAMQLDAGMSLGNYVGFNADDTLPNPQNLTAAGSTDWRIWGAASTNLAGDARKNGGSGISDLTDVNPSPVIPLRALGPLGLTVGTGTGTVPFSFAWTDGATSSSATAQPAGLQHNNSASSLAPGYGFSFTVPAPTSASRLTVWLSAHHGTGRLTATLGTASQTDLGVSGGQNHGGIYTIDFTGSAPGQSMTVSYVLDSAVSPTSTVDSDGAASTEANVVIYAAALSAPTADFTIGATPNALTIVQGSSAQSAIATTEVTAPGSVGLSAVVSPATPGVTVALSTSSVAAGGSATLAVSASASAVPGPYAVTVTGLEGATSHQTIVAANIVPSTGAPIMFRAVPNSSTSLQVAGLVHGSPATTYSVRLWTSSSCAGGVLGSPTALSTTVIPATDASGDSYFTGSIPIASPAGTYVAAQVVPPGAGSPIGPCIVVSPDNDSWVRALDISGLSPMTSSGYVDAAGRGRWFKFTIQPGSRVSITLSNLPADYDLFLFKDIGQAYTTLTDTASLTKLSAEFSPSAFSPSAFSPSAFSPSAFSPSAFSPSAFSPSAFSPSAFSPSAFSPSAFSPSAFSPSAFSPSAFSPSAFSPSAFSPSAFSPSAFSPSAFSADAFSSAQTRSLIGVSANTGTSDETLVGDTWTNTGSFYVLVGGKNGASSLAQPFSLSVTVTGNTCAGVVPLGTPPPAPSAQGLSSVVIEDTSRQPGGSTDVATLQTKLATFAGRPEVGGAVVDLAGPAYSQIQQLNAQADSHPDCVYGKNLVASAIKNVVAAYRTTNPGLKYVVLIGGDKVIPFFRYPDQSLLGPESDYVPPVNMASASEASLRSNYVLGQDEYGAATSISQGAISFPVPDLPVGRLVETAAEESGMIDAYLATAAGVTPTPSTSLVTGYDFLADAATSVQGDLNAGTGQTGDALISPNNIAPTAGWTATQLKSALLGSRHDLIFLAGHFSANNALAADFSTTINSTDLAASSVNLTNSIVFSAGCHSGYNIVDSDALAGVTQPLDWAQAFAQKKATLIAGTGYQYGDTDFIEYSERIYAEFAHQLRIGPNPDGTGAVSVGQALMRAKQVYLARTPDIRGLHQKALLEATLFGLPMLSVNLPTGRIPAASSGSIVPSTSGFSADPGQTLGLRSADLSISPATTAHSVTMTNLAGGPNLSATYYSGRDGVVTNPGEPAVPLQSENVSVSGQVLRGVGFRSGSFSDSTVIPLTGAPNTEIRGVHAAFSSTAFFPMRPWTINYFDALGSSAAATRLLVTPAQHRVATIGDTNATLRLYSQLGLRLFYSSYTGDAALSAAPTMSGVSGVLNGATISFQARVVGNPAAGIQQVWVTYTGTSGTGTDTWQSIDLAQDATDSTLWTGSLTLPSTTAAANLRFMIQAVNGVGLVSLDDNLGAYYAAAGPSTMPPTATTLSLDSSAPTTGVYGSVASVGATLTGGAGPLANEVVAFSIGATTRVATTDAYGHATASLPLTSVPGSYTVTAGFGGDTGLSPSSAAHAFSITSLPTTIALNPASSTVLLGADSGVTATLADGNGAAMPYRTIFFVLSGPVARTTAAITDFAGRASLGPLPATVGVYSVAACFDGPTVPAPCSSLAIPDSTYQPSGATASITLAWPFGGFYSPVDNLPIINLANGGSAIPVKFSLGGDRGLGILNGTPTVVRYTCTSATVDAIETTDTATTSGLRYDATSGVYTYVWKTAKAYAGSCYQLRLVLVDGTTHVANFKFQ